MTINYISAENSHIYANKVIFIFLNLIFPLFLFMKNLLYERVDSRIDDSNYHLVRTKWTSITQKYSKMQNMIEINVPKLHLLEIYQ